MPRDVLGTENWQESANDVAAKKKKKQTSENMVKRFFAYSHLLIRIFAHSCIHCETSAFVLQLLSLQVAFSCSFLFSSLLMFIL